MGGQHNATKAFNYLTGCIAFRIIRSTAQTETVVSRTLMHIIEQTADALWMAMQKKPQKKHTHRGAKKKMAKRMSHF